MNTLDNGIDRILAKAANEAVNADAALLEGFADTQLPKDVSLRAAATVKTGKHRTSFGRLYKKAVGVAAALIAVISLAYTVNIYATYERQEIWGIDIVDNGDHFIVSIVSTQRSKNVVDEKRAPSIEPENADEKTEQDLITAYVITYSQNGSTVMRFSQYCSMDASCKYDDDCTFSETWIKNNKALYTFFGQSGRSEVWWFDGEYFYTITSYDGLPVEELVRIANSVG